jgi:hypothetical protein
VDFWYDASKRRILGKCRSNSESCRRLHLAWCFIVIKCKGDDNFTRFVALGRNGIWLSVLVDPLVCFVLNVYIDAAWKYLCR